MTFCKKSYPCPNSGNLFSHVFVVKGYAVFHYPIFSTSDDFGKTAMSVTHSLECNLSFS